MLKNAYEKGLHAALTRFGLIKEALDPSLMQKAMMGGRSFLRGQAGALGEMGHGISGMMAPTAPARAAGRQMAMSGAKGLLPSAGIVGGGMLAAHMLGGDDQRQQQPPQYMG